MVAGGAFGWVWRGIHYAWKDLLSARNRIRGARRVFRRETLWSAGAVVVAVLVVRALMV
jgi:hypothetical protein